MNKDVISVRVGTTLKEAIKIFNENNFNALPVLNEIQWLVGIISERDIIDYSRKKYATPNLETPKWTNPRARTWSRYDYKLGAETLEEVFVEDVMTKRVTTAQAETSVTEIARLMSRKKINHVPIVDSTNKLVGIIAREDIISYLASGD